MTLISFHVGTETDTYLCFSLRVHCCGVETGVSQSDVIDAAESDNRSSSAVVGSG